MKILGRSRRLLPPSFESLEANTMNLIASHNAQYQS
jgi:hypothetical protein